jgi:protein-S-isoprenylcysteine O-methyltransferase Ste14
VRTTSIVGFLVMVAGVVALVVRDAIFSHSLVGIGIQAGAVALMIWARVTFGLRSLHAAGDATAGGLVTSGPYRVIRHPIYTAVCLFAWTGVLENPSVVSLLIGVLLTAGAITRLLAEERLIVQRYPAYSQYAQKTKRMVPFLF